MRLTSHLIGRGGRRMGSGPLAGVRVLEFTGLAPAPFACMLLADLGAAVVRVDRPGRLPAPDAEVLLRGRRRAVAADLKHPAQRDAVLALADGADVLVEGFRPGVMERLGLGPDVCLGRNPSLVYGRMTGWGQDGPLAQAAGHDINYIGLSGALHGIGRGGRPSPPVNYLGDFGGGGMLLAFAMASALLAVRNGAPGQVIDCAMTEGSALLTALTHGLHAAGQWRDEAGANLIDGGSPWYDAYRTADGKWIAVGALEPQFRLVLLEKLGLGDAGADDDALGAAFTATFAG